MLGVGVESTQLLDVVLDRGRRLELFIADNDAREGVQERVNTAFLKAFNWGCFQVGLVLLFIGGSERLPELSIRGWMPEFGCCFLPWPPADAGHVLRNCHIIIIFTPSTVCIIPRTIEIFLLVSHFLFSSDYNRGRRPFVVGRSVVIVIINQITSIDQSNQVTPGLFLAAKS